MTIIGVILGIVICFFKLHKTFKKALDELKKKTEETENTNKVVSNSNLELNNVKCELNATKKELEQTKNELSEIKKELKENKNAKNIANITKALAMFVCSQPDSVKNGTAKLICNTLGFEKNHDVFDVETEAEEAKVVNENDSISK